jgi:hypothetical protein
VKPGRFNIRLRQGDTWAIAPKWKIGYSYVDITGYTAKMQVRIATTSTSVITELSTEDGRITLNPSKGQFNITLTAEETAELNPGNYVYDFEVTSPGGAEATLLQGGFTVVAQVTH